MRETQKSTSQTIRVSASLNGSELITPRTRSLTSCTLRSTTCTWAPAPVGFSSIPFSANSGPSECMAPSPSVLRAIGTNLRRVTSEICAFSTA